MTGFGRAAVKSNLGTIICEIKTVNHRYLDIFTKLPRELQSFDPKIKECIRQSIQRGRVEVTLEKSGGDHSTHAEVNIRLARTYLKGLERLEKELKLKDTPTLNLLCQMPGVIELYSSPLQTEKIWEDVKKSVSQAIESLLVMREREGRFIENELRKRLASIGKRLGNIEKRLPVLLKKYRKKVKDKSPQLNAEAEIEKIDIAEEVSRLSSHMKQLNIFLKDEIEAGKKITFTIQEMAREANTISAKANDFPISRTVVFIKTELEKIKEQVQNIE